MPRFIDTTGNASLAIFICDRCRMKRPIDESMSDHNFAGLKVCQQGCADEKDPYRLPARKTEKITLRFPRPDVNIDVNPNDIVTTIYGSDVLSTTQSGANPSQSGNSQPIILQP